MTYVPELAVNLATKFEGLHKCVVIKDVPSIVPYFCPALVYTIGYGHTGPDVVPGLVWSPGYALGVLANDLSKAASQALILCPNLRDATDGRYTAIIDFAFNCGAGNLRASTLRRKVLASDWNGVKDQLRKWVYGGGRKLPGLILRREAEIALI